MTQTSNFTLAELMIVAASEAWRGNGEILASGIGILPRIAAGLAKLTHTPELLMTDSEAYFVETPVPLGPRGDWSPKFSGWMPFSRIFDGVWRGQRHAMVGPTQIDRYGQANISCLGEYSHPKVQMLGARGFPGNSINHINSMFIPSHTKRVFVSGEVDMVASAGYNPARWPDGKAPPFLDLRRIVTDLCVMDFGGPGHAIRILSLHPGVTLDEVRDATGFPLEAAPECATTPAPTSEQLEVIRKLDPHDMRATVLKNNPPGMRQAQVLTA